MNTNTPRRAPRRIPPRRRRRVRSVFTGFILPLFKLAAVAALVLLLGGMVLGKIARPFQLYSKEDREVRKIESELKKLEKENADLMRRLEHLNTPQGIAQAARQLGWVKPGEITLVIPDPLLTETRDVEYP